MISVIISSLALLAALVCVAVTLTAERRNQKRKAACIHYVDKTAEMILEKIGALENGVVPDFEKAKEAANAVNNFNAGITGILGFDPYHAIRAQREENSGGE